MKLGLQLGYWGAQPPTNHARTRRRRPRRPVSTRCSPRRRGARTPTRRWRGGAARPPGCGSARRWIQLSARTPTACAMAALTLDHLSGGRHILGLGVSGPQVVEGWYGAKFPSRWPAPANTSTSCARSGRGKRRSQRRPALPAAADRRGHHRTRQDAQADHPPAAGRHPGHAGRRRPEERRAGRRDLRRLAADLLQPAHRRHVQRVARRGLRPSRAPAAPGRPSRSARRRRSSSPTTARRSWS